MFKNEVKDMHSIMQKLKKNAQGCLYSLADLIVLSPCVEMSFLEGMLDRCLMLTFLKWSF